jgi:hypothetical protein
MPYERRSSAKEAWRGLTIFYNNVDSEVYYIDTPDGLVPVMLNAYEKRAFETHYADWNHRAEKTEAQQIAQEIYLLTMKASGKELNPRAFNSDEQAAFNEADAQEWRQWIKNGVVKILTREEEARVPKSKIFSAPMRFVRTQKGDKSKSRIVIPGHKDPELGTFRTDSPTT